MTVLECCMAGTPVLSSCAHSRQNAQRCSTPSCLHVNQSWVHAWSGRAGRRVHAVPFRAVAAQRMERQVHQCIGQGRTDCAFALQLGVSALPQCNPVTAAPADRARGYSCLPGSITTKAHLVRTTQARHTKGGERRLTQHVSVAAAPACIRCNAWPAAQRRCMRLALSSPRRRC